MSFLGFSKSEFRSVVVILLIIGSVTMANMRIALRRARDSQRRSDLGRISEELIAHQKKYGLFPFSDESGRIVGCNPQVIDEKTIKFDVCEWYGGGAFGEMAQLNGDPHHKSGAKYYYLSNGKRFQIFASLEGSDEDEYKESVKNRNLPCGNRICNMGKAYANTPVDISIDEYEMILIEQEKKNETK